MSGVMYPVHVRGHVHCHVGSCTLSCQGSCTLSCQGSCTLSVPGVTYPVRVRGHVHCLIRDLVHIDVAGIFLFAECHNCEPLSQASESYIHAHFIAVTEEDEYLDLSKDILVRILQSENLLIENEVQVFQAAMKWIEHNVSLRRRCVFDVLAPVRFPIVSCKQLYSHMEQCGDLSLKIALRKLMQDFYGSQWQPYERHIGRLKPYLLQPRKCARKNMYVVGGYSRDPGGRWSDSRSLATVECFNSFQQQWTKLASLRHPRSGHGIAILDGCIYVVGGESDSLIFDNTECFNPATQKWTTIPSMTVPRCGLGVCACNNKIYAIGGWIGSQIGDTVERFDPELNRWIEVDRVQTLRFAMGVIEYKGKSLTGEQF